MVELDTIKTQRKTTGSNPYELLYWPRIPGRGEFIRLAFEATGTPYVDVGNATPEGIKDVVSQIRPSPSSDGTSRDEHNPPPFAPPMLRHGSLLPGQTSSILLYLGTRLGLVPSAEEDLDAVFHVSTLTLTALDAFRNEAHDVHHPVATSLNYEDQQQEAKRGRRASTAQRGCRGLWSTVSACLGLRTRVEGSISMAVS